MFQFNFQDKKWGHINLFLKNYVNYKIVNKLI